MALPPPDPLDIGGEESFLAYQERFDSLYKHRKIIDCLGRTVTFGADSCRHVCFKEDRTLSNDPIRRYDRTVWMQERANLIHWIEIALTDPDEIRWNHAVRDHQSYFLAFPSIDIKIPQLRFYVSVELTRDPRWVKFETAFPPDARYWIEARRSKTNEKPIFRKKGRR